MPTLKNKRRSRRLRFGALLFVASIARLHGQSNADPKDLLARGAALTETKPADAIKLLREAVRLDAELPGLHYQLGLAYHGIGDEADAETEFREAVDRAPDSAGAHNYLGIALFQQGHVQDALAEFQAAAKLAPKDPNAHFNLGEALARTGDSAGALEQLRTASALAPADGSLARLLASVETALTPTTIKVDVRQVLVPVVVTDRAGHRISGLKQADFRLFEDGVEQKIASFSEESSGDAETDGAPPVVSHPISAPKARSAGAPSAKPRRTYMVVIDTLHTQSARLTSAREALLKLFREERSADSQYVVVALGESAEVIVNVTLDASAVLSAFENKRFQKLLADAQTGSLSREMDRLRRDLMETRSACDQTSDEVFKMKCAAGIERTSSQTKQIAELEQTLTAGFLRQFGSLVAQLARARDRRTILLISDGFSLEPGRDALSMFNAFFPPASHCLIPADVFCPQNPLLPTGRLTSDFEPVLKLASGGNIVIDTINSRGLYGPKGFDAADEGAPRTVEAAVTRAERDRAASQGNALIEIASATGGTAYRDSNNLLTGMQLSFAKARNYYSLAYVSTNATADGKFRAITVEVKDKNAVVNAKRGYWAQ